LMFIDIIYQTRECSFLQVLCQIKSGLTQLDDELELEGRNPLGNIAIW